MWAIISKKQTADARGLVSVGGRGAISHRIVAVLHDAERSWSVARAACKKTRENVWLVAGGALVSVVQRVRHIRRDMGHVRDDWG